MAEALGELELNLDGIDIDELVAAAGPLFAEDTQEEGDKKGKKEKKDKKEKDEKGEKKSSHHHHSSSSKSSSGSSSSKSKSTSSSSSSSSKKKDDKSDSKKETKSDKEELAKAVASRPAPAPASLQPNPIPKESAKAEYIPGDTTLHKLAKAGDLPKFKAAVLTGKYDLEGRDEDSATPLHVAAENGRLEIVEFIAQRFGPQGKNLLNAKTEHGSTALHFACLCDIGERTALKLVEYGADVTVADSSGRLPIHWAARQGMDEFIDKCVEKGVSPFVEDKNGWTPLHHAAKEGSVVSCLLFRDKYKASGYKKGNAQQSPYDLADKDEEDLVKSLMWSEEHEQQTYEKIAKNAAEAGEIPEKVHDWSWDCLYVIDPNNFKKTIPKELIDKEMLILRDDRLYHKTPGTPYVSFNNRAGKKMLLADGKREIDLGVISVDPNNVWVQTADQMFPRYLTDGIHQIQYRSYRLGTVEVQLTSLYLKPHETTFYVVITIAEELVFGLITNLWNTTNPEYKIDLIVYDGGGSQKARPMIYYDMISHIIAGGTGFVAFKVTRKPGDPSKEGEDDEWTIESMKQNLNDLHHTSAFKTLEQLGIRKNKDS